jgi:hypothetical protein
MPGTPYLIDILNREAVDTSVLSPIRGVQTTLAPVLNQWGNGHLQSIAPSGSFAKGTANRSGTDIDLFLSLSTGVTDNLRDIYNSLFNAVSNAGYKPNRQNVSINIRVGAYDVDLVPARQHDNISGNHSLYLSRADSWMQTNVARHIADVRAGNRLNETRILKLWRNQNGLDFLSFYLELTTIQALTGKYGTLATNVWDVFKYLRDDFLNARVVDPANTNNVISDDLTVAAKTAIRNAAINTLSKGTWAEVIK